jgi:hypothetical protein
MKRLCVLDPLSALMYLVSPALKSLHRPLLLGFVGLILAIVVLILLPGLLLLGNASLPSWIILL